MTGFFEGTDNDPQPIVHSLNDHDDVSTVFLEDGSRLVYNLATATWESAAPLGTIEGGQTINTVAEMQANVELEIGDYVQTAGYTAIGDLGDNFYQIVAGGTGTGDGGAYIDLANGLQAKALWPNGRYSIKQYGAIGDGATDNLTVFAAIDASTVSKNWYIPDGTYNSSGTIFGRDLAFVLSADASIVLNGGATAWLPNLYTWDRQGTDALYKNIKKVNRSGTDPSPVLVPNDYIQPDDATVQRIEYINQWGTQYDVTGASQGRTGYQAAITNVNHSGEGDCYGHVINGTVQRHSRFADIVNTGGHNNIGLGGGQMQATTDQVSLYGWGDIKLKDQGYDNVAMRGVVTILDHTGSDNVAYGYEADRFCYLGISATNEIGGMYIAKGPAKVGIDLTDCNLSEAGINLSADQYIYFDASGASRDSSYVATDNGEFWIAKNTTDACLELQGLGNRIQIFAGITAFSTTTAGTATVRAYADSPVNGSTTSYLGIGASGSIAYVSAATGATGNVSMALRTQLSGASQDTMFLRSNGHINTPYLPTYADEAAALAGSLPTGDWYQTATGELRIKL